MLVASAASASPTVGWRGDGTGRFPAARPPTTWSGEQNIVWSTPISKWGNASPVVVGDRIFVSAEPSSLVCVSSQDGKVLWERSNNWEDLVAEEQKSEIDANAEQADALWKELSPLKSEWRELWHARLLNPNDPDLKARMRVLRKRIMELVDKREPLVQYAKAPTQTQVNGYTSATPASDGGSVYMVLGTGIVVCYDLEGNRKWCDILERPRDINDWGHSASPLLVDGKLLVHIFHLIALDPRTGKEIWRTPAASAFGTAAMASVGSTRVVVTPQGDVVRVSDGEKLAEGLFELPYGNPVIYDGVVYAVDEAGDKAVRLVPAEGGKIRTETVWENVPERMRSGNRYYASPLVHDGLLYVINEVGVLRAIDVGTGQACFEKKMFSGPGTVFPSITLAGERLLVSRDTGDTVLLEPGREYKEIGVNLLPERFRATPTPDGKRLYIRGLERLYCIGE